MIETLIAAIVILLLTIVFEIAGILLAIAFVTGMKLGPGKKEKNEEDEDEIVFFPPTEINPGGPGQMGTMRIPSDKLPEFLKKMMDKSKEKENKDEENKDEEKKEGYDINRGYM